MALAVTTLAAAAEPRVGKYMRYDAGEFVIVSSRGGGQARRIIEDLTKFRVTLERALGRRVTSGGASTTILLVGNRDWTQWLQPRANISGYFQAGRFSNHMALDGEAPIQYALPVVFHEYTHYFLATQFAGEYPPFFNEGLAELMGYAMFEKGKTVLRIPEHLVHEARVGNWIPFERLIKVSHYDAEYQSHRLMPSFYAQSWLTVHYGMLENREFGGQIIAYLNELNRLTPQEDAARKVFGADLSVPDGKLRAYSRKYSMSSGAMALGEIPAPVITEGKPVDEFEVMALFADFMLDTGRTPGAVRPLLESLERRDPNKARAAILAARVAQRDDDNAAFAAAARRAEAALVPGDWEQRRDLATVLLASANSGNLMSSRSGADNDRDVGRAMMWFGEAINHNNQDVEALWGFGTAATRANRNLDLAEQALLTAYKLAPSNAEIAVSLANLKARQEKPEEMLPYLKDAVRFATNLGMRRWAADSIVELEKWIAERDQVEAENRRQREEYERQLAEYEKKYGKKKRK